jgi:hypothetical protein
MYRYPPSRFLRLAQASTGLLCRTVLARPDGKDAAGPQRDRHQHDVDGDGTYESDFTFVN